MIFSVERWIKPNCAIEESLTSPDLTPLDLHNGIYKISVRVT